MEVHFQQKMIGGTFKNVHYTQVSIIERCSLYRGSIPAKIALSNHEVSTMECFSVYYEEERKMFFNSFVLILPSIGRTKFCPLPLAPNLFFFDLKPKLLLKILFQHLWWWQEWTKWIQRSQKEMETGFGSFFKTLTRPWFLCFCQIRVINNDAIHHFQHHFDYHS